ncbi:DUF1444 family protein [Granulicella mallensis]|uniref:DUF1444 family protein n=1 Tax=Granulicella mallensis (strain ATCC BAA-1857 / DSM 23137 / MP5ACTX8) TaxID=682795 RepID=G8P1S0_GRAMM|nr:DUF1444 family protein [Granulicella mallensis]AEU35895.1 protein of unknown function DUF1444 [Granulicella mallensis MP5ACTX8]
MDGPRVSTLDRMVQQSCSRDELFLLYSKLLEERLGVSDMKFVHADVISFQKAGGGEMHSYLQNLWIAYSRNPQSRAEVIEQYLKALASTMQPASAITREQIIPLIKDSEYFSIFKNKPNILVSEHLVADLFVVYAVDWPDRTATLSQSEFEKLGLEMSGLRQLAVENLKGMLTNIECHDGGPWSMVSAGGTYEASILLLDTFWEHVREEVEGDLIAVVPARDVLLFTGASSADGLKEIKERATKIVSTGDHVISATLLRRTNGVWATFD